MYHQFMSLFFLIINLIARFFTKRCEKDSHLFVDDDTRWEWFCTQFLHAAVCFSHFLVFAFSAIILNQLNGKMMYREKNQGNNTRWRGRYLSLAVNFKSTRSSRWVVWDNNNVIKRETHDIPSIEIRVGHVDNRLWWS